MYLEFLSVSIVAVLSVTSYSDVPRETTVWDFPSCSTVEYVYVDCLYDDVDCPSTQPKCKQIVGETVVYKAYGLCFTAIWPCWGCLYDPTTDMKQEYPSLKEITCPLEKQTGAAIKPLYCGKGQLAITKQDDYLYSTVETDTNTNGYVSKGRIGSLPANAEAGYTVILKQYWDQYQYGYFYTTGNTYVSSAFTYKGEVGNCFATRLARVGLVPFYRYYNYGSSGYSGMYSGIYTIDELSFGYGRPYNSREILCYVYLYDSSGSAQSHFGEFDRYNGHKAINSNDMWMVSKTEIVIMLFVMLFVSIYIAIIAVFICCKAGLFSNKVSSIL